MILFSFTTSLLNQNTWDALDELTLKKIPLEIQ